MTTGLFRKTYCVRKSGGLMKFMILSSILIVASAALVGCARDDAESIPYEPDFVELVEADKVDHVRVVREPSGLVHISGWTKPNSLPGKKFRVEVVGSYDSVAELLRTNSVGHSSGVAQPEPNGWDSLAMLPVLISIAWIVFVICVSIFLLVLALRFVRAVERIADNTGK